MVNARRVGERAGVEPSGHRLLVGRQGRIADEIRPLTPKPAKALLLVVCVTAIGIPDWSVSTPVEGPVVHQRGKAALVLAPTTGAERQVPHRRVDEHMRVSPVE